MKPYGILNLKFETYAAVVVEATCETMACSKKYNGINRSRKGYND
jgi:hypothetical protein